MMPKDKSRERSDRNQPVSDLESFQYCRAGIDGAAQATFRVNVFGRPITSDQSVGQGEDETAAEGKPQAH
jgi:hypothetical protein